MNQIIIDKLNNIYDDFKRDINYKSNLCELRNFNFCSDNIPNYNNEMVQRFYLLRYMLGYFCEYFTIYEELIDRNFLSNDLNICSIGCGCGLDLWGLEYAKQNIDKNINIKYTGIDKVDWLYKDNMNEDVQFINEDLDKSNNLHGNDYNIIIFPKSIGEFDIDILIKLLVAIYNTKFNSNRLVLISSMRSSKLDLDKSNMAAIVKLISNKYGYRVLDDIDKPLSFEKKGNGCDYRINDIIPGLFYPRDIKEDVSNMYLNCKSYKEYKTSCKNCRYFLSRRPITTMSQVNCQIIRLERN